MGSARTWRRHVPWLRERGHVYTFDAAGHGRPAPALPTTESFVADLASSLEFVTEPMVVIGHSMGGLHGWCFAAAHPDRVCGLVVEDMAPDFRGRTAANWAAMIGSWPTPFRDRQHLVEFFGPVAAQYFMDSFDLRDDGYHLHGEVSVWREISEEWGTRDFWTQWSEVRAPALLLEGEFTITPEGQMRQMASTPRESATLYERVAGAGHLVHDDRPVEYRRAVEEFLVAL